MKKTIILLMLAFLPTLLMAQAAGGHVVRKPKPTAVAPKPAPKPKPKPQSAPKPKPAPKQKPQTRPSSHEYPVQTRSSNLPPVIQNLVNNMVYVQGGTFTMGTTPDQGSEIYSYKTQAHQVTLSSFSIGKYEVTQEEWEAVMGSNPSRFKGAKRPVEGVNWDDCQTFIRKLNAMTGKQFRLPTEAEWEYAVRGGNRSRGYKYSGSDNIGSVAWYSGNANDETHIVVQKLANELGLYDMNGNVREWCQDWYGPYLSSPQMNPKGALSGINHVSRGGSFLNEVTIWRVTYLNDDVPDYPSSDTGFRLAL